MDSTDDAPTLPPADAPAPPPALIVRPREALLLSADGEVESLSLAQAAGRVARQPPLVCHARAVARRLDCPPFAAFDLLELWAFVRPGHFCVPTPAGLAAGLDLAPPEDSLAEAMVLLAAAERLLAEATDKARFNADPAPALLAMSMARAGWAWGPALLAALGGPGEGRGNGFDVWRDLPEWEDGAPPPPPDDRPVAAEEARARLAELVGPDAEARPQQADYAAETAAAFVPRRQPGQPQLVLAEAGTGVGKTLGYLAPASLWAERNGAPVWISTYTRNLQRQVDQELDRLYPDPAVKRRRAVVRKGRENYLCLLNFHDAAARAAAGGREAIAAGLMARWIAATRDGDMVGGDFPAWLVGLLGIEATLGLADRRGECIYSACQFYRKCFIERVRRTALQADLVIANHALVLSRAAGLEESDLPLRYVFDEGHHVFDAADSAFAAAITGQEGAELRRWLIGTEGGRRSGRGRNLEQRIGDLVGEDETAREAMAAALKAARALPGPGWLKRLGEGAGAGPAERFLAEARRHVLARAGRAAGAGYSLEAPTHDPDPDLLAAAAALSEALRDLEQPLVLLARRLLEMLDEGADELDSGTRARIEAGAASLNRRGIAVVTAWRSMLADLEEETGSDFVDWFELVRQRGRESDAGLRRHWVDPTRPFAELLLARAHGAVLTSATLRDRAPETPDDWSAAEVRTGAMHLPLPALRSSHDSPFDYAGVSRLIVVHDVRREKPDEVAAAYRALFLASGGGALGLFTAIERLRQAHERLAAPLDEAGLRLLAQHVDAMDVGTLVDIFRAEPRTCLLGTDAVRDGVDVPGPALRLIVMDRVPWPRPSLLHKARRARFGGAAYDDMLARLRLKQAFGRLIRAREDRGVFVLLDAMTPTRLLTAFPDGLPVERLGLAEAVAATSEFFAPNSG